MAAIEMDEIGMNAVRELRIEKLKRSPAQCGEDRGRGRVEASKRESVCLCFIMTRQCPHLLCRIMTVTIVATALEGLRRWEIMYHS